MEALAVAGLVRDAGQAVYEMHPLVTSYLRSRGDAAEPCQRAFVGVMGSFADAVAPRELHEQRDPFLLHGANFHFALALSERLSMDQHIAMLTQCLAAYALNCRRLEEASRLYAWLAAHRAARGHREGEAAAYHQLGIIAAAQRDFAAAREWCLKSLAIKEEEGNLQGAAITLHQLGMVAQEQRDFPAAQESYLKSLAISEKLGIEAYAASTYHQLGMIAAEQRDFAAAREWYLKSVAIEEKLGNLHRAATTYHQLGIVAQEERDSEAARKWCLKSLTISEKRADLHGAASTYGQLGILAGLRAGFEESGKWMVRSIAAFLEMDDQNSAQRNIRNFLVSHRLASPADKQKLEAIWRDANLGPFPTEPSE